MLFLKSYLYTMILKYLLHLAIFPLEQKERLAVAEKLYTQNVLVKSDPLALIQYKLNEPVCFHIDLDVLYYHRIVICKLYMGCWWQTFSAAPDPKTETLFHQTLVVLLSGVNGVHVHFLLDMGMILTTHLHLSHVCGIRWYWLCLVPRQSQRGQLGFHIIQAFQSHPYPLR